MPKMLNPVIQIKCQVTYFPMCGIEWWVISQKLAVKI